MKMDHRQCTVVVSLRNVELVWLVNIFYDTFSVTRLYRVDDRMISEC
jgi:hypothetical protein